MAYKVTKYTFIAPLIELFVFQSISLVRTTKRQSYFQSMNYDLAPFSTNWDTKGICFVALCKLFMIPNVSRKLANAEFKHILGTLVIISCHTVYRIFAMASSLTKCKSFCKNLTRPSLINIFHKMNKILLNRCINPLLVHSLKHLTLVSHSDNHAESISRQFFGPTLSTNIIKFFLVGVCISTVTVYPKKYAHGFCFAELCCGYTLTDFPIFIRLTSLALWQSNDCPSASKATLMNMDKYFMWIHYERLHNHNKAKHNKTVCIFLGVYCMSLLLCIRLPAILSLIRCMFPFIYLAIYLPLSHSIHLFSPSGKA